MLTSIPWGKLTDENFDIDSAKAILDEDHYGMKMQKIAFWSSSLLKLKGSVQGKYCLNGPPGVGKADIVTIAHALNRNIIVSALVVYQCRD